MKFCTEACRFKLYGLLISSLLNQYTVTPTLELGWTLEDKPVRKVVEMLFTEVRKYLTFYRLSRSEFFNELSSSYSIFKSLMSIVTLRNYDFERPF